VKITEFSLRNPLVITAIALAVAFYGLFTYFSLGVSLFPSVSFPEVEITTVDAGADPATIETQVTKPIEDAVAGLANIDTISSVSSEGVSTVGVQFTTAANSDLVSVDVERQVNSVRSKLPTGAEAPSIFKLDLDAIPVIYVAVSGPQPLDQLQKVATDRLQKPLEAVPGVGSVTVGGGQTREVQVKVDLNKLQARGLGLNTVQTALQSEQLEVPSGVLTGPGGKEVNVRVTGLVAQPADLAKIVVAQTPSGPVYLGDVATIEDGAKKQDVISRVNGSPAVRLNVTKLASANTIDVSQAIRAKMAEIQPSLPQGMVLDVTYDAATYTQASFNTIRTTLLEAIFFTGIILLLFLHTWRSTTIVLIAIPTSVLTAFVMMKLLHYNLNLMSMLALTLSVGILVDDSIVVLENIYRHMGLHEPPYVAAINGRSEIGLAAITITMVDVVVYLPIALMSGVAGDFIRPFAMTIAAATLISLVVSFTLTPLLASRFLTVAQVLKHGSGPLAAFGRWWDRFMVGLGHRYQGLLRLVITGKLVRFGFVRSGVLRLTGGRFGGWIPTSLGARWGVIVVGTLTLVAGVALVVVGLIGFDFFPSGDQSEVDIELQMPPATAIETTDSVAQLVTKRLRAMPEVREVTAYTGNVGGGIGLGGGDTSFIIALLTPKNDRTKSSSEIADELRQTLPQGIPGATFHIQLPNAFGFGGFGGQPIQIAVRGPDPNVLNRLVDQVTAEVRSVPGAVEVNNANERVRSEDVFHINRGQAADQGLTAAQVADTVRTAVDGSVVAKYHLAGQDDVDIRLMADDNFRSSPSHLGTLPLLTNKGAIVRLDQLGTIDNGAAPTEIDHVDRERTVTVNASASGRDVGSVQNDIQARLNQIQLPPGYTIKYQGSASQGATAFSDLFAALGIAIILMYVLMTMLFGSATLPLAVIGSLPLAVVGSLTAMAITATPFTIFSMLGFALLVGLVGKNAILLVDYTDTLRKRGHTRTEALLEAGPTRLRPILMTSLSIIVALAPVAFGAEEGSELLKAAAVVLIGGLTTSTLLTLVVVPAMYTIFDDINAFFAGIFHRIAPPRALEPAEIAIIHGANYVHANGAVGTHAMAGVGESVLRSEN
jgi:hydrophobic/amphiphilic exporter-1 (mainly G- bacteria), HAE1 family